jgi:DNA polymerase III delta prime subunit
MNPFLVLKEKNKNESSKRRKLEPAEFPIVKSSIPKPPEQSMPIIPTVITPIVSPVVPIVPMVKPLFIDSIIDRIKKYLQNPANKILLLEGPTGCGKTYTLDYIANSLGYVLDTYDPDVTMDEFIYNSNLNVQKRLLVIDYIESLDLTDIQKHLDVLIQKHCIITTLNVYDSNVYKWKLKIDILRMKPYTTKEIISLLDTTDADLIQQCQGDIRYGLLMKKYMFHGTQDNFYDLFGTSKQAILSNNVSGIQSQDLFMFQYMLQHNVSSWSLNTVKTLDAFCNIDLQDQNMSSENVCDYLNTILAATSCQKVPALQMPRIPNISKVSRCLRLAVPGTGDTLSQHDTLNCVRTLMPERLTKTSEYYHDNPDVRTLRKTSPFKL